MQKPPKALKIGYIGTKMAEAGYGLGENCPLGEPPSPVLKQGIFVLEDTNPPFRNRGWGISLQAVTPYLPPTHTVISQPQLKQ